ncbi:hypothetical protein GCM10010324_31930 [Streptomyces hiroshimensis]|uniref:Uncharacterized protein n=1 Tax=Streptomyces hiroshimensis TaxID=66424 RepID=A0ABQ2YH61_9ACTN|nr:hypothetical protein GCM10010324_31930 [Streptomyces hiroshimensis]
MVPLCGELHKAGPDLKPVASQCEDSDCMRSDEIACNPAAARPPPAAGRGEALVPLSVRRRQARAGDIKAG